MAKCDFLEAEVANLKKKNGTSKGAAANGFSFDPTMMSLYGSSSHLSAMDNPQRESSKCECDFVLRYCYMC